MIIDSIARIVSVQKVTYKGTQIKVSLPIITVVDLLKMSREDNISGMPVFFSLTSEIVFFLIEIYDLIILT